MVKKYLTIQTLKTLVDNNIKLGDIFKADAIIFLDEKTTEIYKLYEKGIDENKIVNTIKSQV